MKRVQCLKIGRGTSRSQSYNKGMRVGRPRQVMAMQLLMLLWLGWCLPLHAQLVEVGDGGPGPVKAQHLTAEMTALRPQIAAGGTLTAGLVLPASRRRLPGRCLPASRPTRPSFRRRSGCRSGR